jgi:SAM-dependent methyltransferase
MTTEPQTPAAPDERIPERFVPEEMRGELVAAEHFARYRWAASFCNGRSALDAGCGAGYGSELINQAGAAGVMAIDVSETALELARASVSEGVTCRSGDVMALPFDDATFDLVVCFEVIEHVDDPERALDELSRVLAPDGLLLVSSPNRDRYVPGNPHHRHEYTRRELQESLDRRFEAARIISQHVMIASVIAWSGAHGVQADTRRVADPKPIDEVYLLAMAGRELPPDPPPTVALSTFAEPREWLAYIDSQQEHLAARQRWIEELERRDAGRMQALERLADAEQELARSRASDLALEEATRDLASARSELAHLRAQISAVKASASWRTTAPLRRAASAVRQRR